MPNYPIKCTNDPNYVPTVEELCCGQMAVNTYTGCIYIKRCDNNIETIINNCPQVIQIGCCTDPVALNYNPECDFDDGSCIYPTDLLSPIFSQGGVNIPEEESISIGKLCPPILCDNQYTMAAAWGLPGLAGAAAAPADPPQPARIDAVCIWSGLYECCDDIDVLEGHDLDGPDCGWINEEDGPRFEYHRGCPGYIPDPEHEPIEDIERVIIELPENTWGVVEDLGPADECRFFIWKKYDCSDRLLELIEQGDWWEDEEDENICDSIKPDFPGHNETQQLLKEKGCCKLCICIYETEASCNAEHICGKILEWSNIIVIDNIPAGGGDDNCASLLLTGLTDEQLDILRKPRKEFYYDKKESNNREKCVFRFWDYVLCDDNTICGQGESCSHNGKQPIDLDWMDEDKLKDLNEEYNCCFGKAYCVWEIEYECNDSEYEDKYENPIESGWKTPKLIGTFCDNIDKDKIAQVADEDKIKQMYDSQSYTWEKYLENTVNCIFLMKIPQNCCEKCSVSEVEWAPGWCEDDTEEEKCEYIPQIPGRAETERLIKPHSCCDIEDTDKCYCVWKIEYECMDTSGQSEHYHYPIEQGWTQPTLVGIYCSKRSCDDMTDDLKGGCELENSYVWIKNINDSVGECTFLMKVPQECCIKCSVDDSYSSPTDDCEDSNCEYIPQIPGRAETEKLMEDNDCCFPFFRVPVIAVMSEDSVNGIGKAKLVYIDEDGNSNIYKINDQDAEITVYTYDEAPNVN